ncbi:MAG TPA: element excision factor XisH family protein [Fimbriiglobus sp.]|nr:element excision factor XisH family protein [Fimbriiglobus sp.]
MPAKNIHHDAVIAALVADGWTITDDPLYLSVEDRKLFVDLAAERNTIAAERDDKKIAVEVQSFAGGSAVRDLQEALGQYAMYRVILARQHPDRPLFMAVPRVVYDGILSEQLGRIVVADLNIRVLVFDPDLREVVRWIS